MILHLPATLLAASPGFDIEQIIFVLVFLLVGFVQWIIKLMNQAKENRERDRKAPSAEEIEARRNAWENQTQPLPQAAPSAPPALPPTSRGGPLEELMESLRRGLEDVSTPPRTPGPAPTPAPAKPSPSPPALPHTPAWASKSQPAPSPAPARTVPTVTPEWGAAVVTTPVTLGSSVEHLHHSKHAKRTHQSAGAQTASRRHLHPLTELLRTTVGYRQAFILREVLGPCKALEDEGR